jgi:hypothetical protein
MPILIPELVMEGQPFHLGKVASMSGLSEWLFIMWPWVYWGLLENVADV